MPGSRLMSTTGPSNPSSRKVAAAVPPVLPPPTITIGFVASAEDMRASTPWGLWSPVPSRSLRRSSLSSEAPVHEADDVVGADGDLVHGGAIGQVGDGEAGLGGCGGDEHMAAGYVRVAVVLEVACVGGEHLVLGGAEPDALVAGPGGGQVRFDADRNEHPVRRIGDTVAGHGAAEPEQRVDRARDPGVVAVAPRAFEGRLIRSERDAGRLQVAERRVDPQRPDAIGRQRRSGGDRSGSGCGRRGGGGRRLVRRCRRRRGAGGLLRLGVVGGVVERGGDEQRRHPDRHAPGEEPQRPQPADPGPGTGQVLGELAIVDDGRRLGDGPDGGAGCEAKLGLVGEPAIQFVPEVRRVLVGRKLSQCGGHRLGGAGACPSPVCGDGAVAVAAGRRRCHDPPPPVSSEPLLRAPLAPFGDAPAPAALRLATFVSSGSAGVLSSASAAASGWGSADAAGAGASSRGGSSTGASSSDCACSGSDSAATSSSGGAASAFASSGCGCGDWASSGDASSDWAASGSASSGWASSDWASSGSAGASSPCASAACASSGCVSGSSAFASVPSARGPVSAAAAGGAARTSASSSVSRARAPASRASSTSGARPRMRAAASGAKPSRSTRTTATRSVAARFANASTTRAWRSWARSAGDAPLPPAGTACAGGWGAPQAASAASVAAGAPGGAAPTRVPSRRNPSMHAL